ncbi:hypothetical protein C3L33_21800, partial [Rhododendron williamsianum]
MDRRCSLKSSVELEDPKPTQGTVEVMPALPLTADDVAPTHILLPTIPHRSKLYQPRPFDKKEDLSGITKFVRLDKTGENVNAFRSMMRNDMMVGAFSHSTAVGKLRKDLPDVPADARVNFTRYNLDEAASVCHYYLRQRLIRREAFSEEGWKKIFYLSNGNGSEMRWLLPFMR